MNESIPASGEKKEEVKKEVKEEGGQSELERAMAATLASLPKDNTISVRYNKYSP